jgi:dCMP deaminase
MENKTVRTSIELVYLGMVDVLEERSTCVRRRVGCIIVDAHNQILATGYNGVPSGVEHCIDVPCGGGRYATGLGLEKCQAVHAEQNALMQCPNVQAIKAIFVSTTPCIHCMKMLLNTSCRTIYANGLYADDSALLLWLERRSGTSLFSFVSTGGIYLRRFNTSEAEYTLQQFTKDELIKNLTAKVVESHEKETKTNA